jgi:hypothetical protein
MYMYIYIYYIRCLAAWPSRRCSSVCVCVCVCVCVYLYELSSTLEAAAMLSACTHAQRAPQARMHSMRNTFFFVVARGGCEARGRRRCGSRGGGAGDSAAACPCCCVCCWCSLYLFFLEYNSTKVRNTDAEGARAAAASARLLRQYLYFCASKASKLSTSSPDTDAEGARRRLPALACALRWSSVYWRYEYKSANYERRGARRQPTLACALRALCVSICTEVLVKQVK